MQNYVYGNRLKKKRPKRMCLHNFLIARGWGRWGWVDKPESLLTDWEAGQWLGEANMHKAPFHPGTTKTQKDSPTREQPSLWASPLQALGRCFHFIDRSVSTKDTSAHISIAVTPSSTAATQT